MSDGSGRIHAGVVYTGHENAVDDEIVNEYETDYGVVLLKTKLISYQYENPLKLRYELYDGNNLISSVYLMVSYLQLEN